ncbi:cadmium-translocating P-type ATPase [Halarcobacter ebronensis]|uniref:P-type Zn(2+) transporter n=1 Tax=Halarcobacter ebronensis TaxID=1462615 RepID=A0A4Q0YGL3_9BACT|nr:heavy metal translocating P-type ATPase [Halarcobacter ebronensis]RXJ69752.1 cadmium-translocating P-type ATPase [Halarcobacter ebronensis]
MQKLKLENLDCAHCALKIESSLNAMEELENVKLNFSTSTLSFEQKGNENIINKIVEVIQSIEKDVNIVEDKKGEARSFWQLLNKKLLLITTISIILTFLSYNYISQYYFQVSMYFLAYLLVGWDVLFKATKNILKGKLFDENFLMGIATIGAFALGEYIEGITVMVFYQIGEMFQAVAVNNSRDSINSLIDLKPDFANVKDGNTIVQKSPEEVKIGETIVVKVGEKVPVDGVLLSNSCSFDTSTITGEFKPKTLNKEDEILSGYINLSQASNIKVTSLYKNSTIAKIIELIENASSQKARAEKFITKFASIYTPFVVVAALLLAFLPPLFIEGALYSDWIERSLVFLVISCPCALVISIPLSFFSAIGAISKKGILVKGANYVEKLTEIENIIFDKTGTLTHGVFKVTKIKTYGIKEEELLELAALSESFSTHPIAKSIVKAFNKEINHEKVSSHEEFSGLGVKAIIQNTEVLVGNQKLLNRFSVDIPEDISEDLNVVFVAINSKIAGFIVVDDVIKEEAKNFIEELKRVQIKKTYMLTGDKKEVALKVANNLGIDEVRYELLPQDKLSSFKEIKEKTGKITAFVGDGINDAPTLASSDIGFAMGGIGSDLAVKSADVVVLNDKLDSILDAIKISKKTKVIVYQNIVFIMIIKVGFLILGAGAIIGMAEAIFADIGVALLAILNSMRILKESKTKQNSGENNKKVEKKEIKNSKITSTKFKAPITNFQSSKTTQTSSCCEDNSCCSNKS